LVRHLPGEVVQTVYVQYTAELLINATQSGTITRSSGTQFLSQAFTPLYSNSKLLMVAGGEGAIFRSPVANLGATITLCVLELHLRWLRGR
jgi:hypothetical protein